MRQRAFPFMGNFCASSGLMSNPSDWAKFMSQVHTLARVQSRGSIGKPSGPYWIFFGGGGSGAWPDAWWRPWLLLHRRSLSLESTLTADRSNGGTRHFAALSTCIAGFCCLAGILNWVVFCRTSHVPLSALRSVIGVGRKRTTAARL